MYQAAEYVDPSAYRQDGKPKSPRTILMDLLETHFIVFIGTDAKIVSWKDTKLGKELQIHTQTAFSLFHSDKKIEYQNGSGEPYSVPLFDEFKKRAKRFKGLVYEPGRGDEVVGGELNLWSGFAVQEKEGNWELMRKHIYDVLADGGREVGDYIIKWSAWTVQNPGKQAEVALVFIGGQGSGKGTYSDTMMRMFGTHSVQLSSSRHLTGNFNKHLMHTSLVVADEAFWAGTKDALGQLKRLITEPRIVIELKGVDIFEVDSCIHLIINSNEDWVIPAGRDERRFMVSNVSEEYVGNREYFNALRRQLGEGGREAMLYELRRMDLGGWHPRLDVPQTEAMTEQKIRSVEGVDKAMLIFANEGCLPCQVPGRPDVVATSGEQGGTGFWSSIQGKVKGLRHETSRSMMPKLKKRYGCEGFKSGNVRGVKFPPLGDLRRQLDKAFGAQDWDLEEEWRESNPRRFNRDA